MARIECYDIEWETDGEKVDLPKSVVIDLEEDEDLTLEELVDNNGADALSDKYGWLVNGFHWKVAKSNS
jgi:hypothetical protein